MPYRMCIVLVLVAAVLVTTSCSSDTTGPPNAVGIMNVPNPFDSQTQINWAIPTSGFVEMSIYDVKGQWVTTLYRGNTEAGNHAVVWNGTDDNGTSVGSGVYFVRIETDDRVGTHMIHRQQ